MTFSVLFHETKKHMKHKVPMYKAVVFDLDGTLVDSPLCFETIRKQLDIPSGEPILEYLDLLPLISKKDKLLRLQEIEVQAARNSVPLPGALEVLRELRSLKINIGLFTRNCRVATDLIIKTNGMSLDMVVTREDAPAKPNPAGLKRFLTQWNLQNHELLFVGDFHFDIECGKRAGVKTALFTNGGRSYGDWKPDHFISHYASFWESIS